MKKYEETKNGYKFEGLNIPVDAGNRHYQQMLAEVDAGEAEITPYVEPPADPKEIRDQSLSSLTHDYGDGRVIQCRPHPFSDEPNMRNAIEQMSRLGQTERVWFGANNTPIIVSASDLQEAIESGQDQASDVWAEFFASLSVV